MGALGSFGCPSGFPERAFAAQASKKRAQQCSKDDAEDIVKTAIFLVFLRVLEGWGTQVGSKWRSRGALGTNSELMGGTFGKPDLPLSLRDLTFEFT